MNSALTAATLDIAAASGAFAPAAMADCLGLAPNTAERDQLWRELSLMVDEVLVADTAPAPAYGWFLTPDRRRAQLEGFVSRAQIDRSLAIAPPLWPEDHFAAALRQMLGGAIPPLPEDTAAPDDAALSGALTHAAAILDAVQFALAVPILDQAALRDLEAAAKRHIQSLQRRRDLTIVLPRRHQGYARERVRLTDHLGGKSQDSRPILLTGIGGVGKSAILASILQDWQGRTDRPLTAILDFDRRQINSGQPVEILGALLRQLESGIAGRLGDAAREGAAAAGLNTFRHALPSFTATGGQRDHGSQLSYLSSLLPGAMQAPWAAPLKTLPIAMVFDSFEAVDRRGIRIVETIFDIEALLRGQFGGLRTVVSGRAEPLGAAALKTYFGPPERNIALAGLDEPSGASLLSEESARLAGAEPAVLTDAALCAEVSRVLGGHPLALLIFARYAQGHPGDIRSLIADLRDNRDFAAEFAQVFLYERILERIDDPQARRLAHPGLILRDFNADLVRFALAGPCLGEGPGDPRPMSASRAAALCKDLANIYWLVEAAKAPFALRHRPDLRRLMLPGLFAGPSGRDSPDRRAEKARLRDSALAACTAAARYFSAGPPAKRGKKPQGKGDIRARASWRAIDPRTRRVHALYYTSFTQPDAPEAFDEATARDIDAEIGEDVDTMPLAWRARINLLIGQTPTEAELATLPPDLREIGIARRFRDEEDAGFGGVARATLVRSASVVAAGKLTVRAAKPSAAPDQPPSAYERDIQRAFATGAFDEVARLAPAYFLALRDRPDDETARRFRAAETEGYWHHPLWQCLLTTAGGVGVDQIAAAAREQDKTQSPYRPVYAAIMAAADRDPDAVAKALSPIFQRNILSPVDFNRTQGREMAGWLEAVQRAADPKVVMTLYPNALCLAAGWAASQDAAFFLERQLQPDNEALHALRSARTPRLDLIAKAFEHRTARATITCPATPMLPPSEYDLAATILRGQSPDLQAPLAGGLATLAVNKVEDIVVGLMPRARFWPEELTFDATRRYDPVQANVIVETADHCGVLRHLLDAVGKAHPGLVPLVSMHDAITDWFFPFARHAPA